MKSLTHGLFLLSFLFLNFQAYGNSPETKLPDTPPPALKIGVNRDNHNLLAWIDPNYLTQSSSRFNLLIVGMEPLDGNNQQKVKKVSDQTDIFRQYKKYIYNDNLQNLTVSFVPWIYSRTESSSNKFPPQGTFYSDENHPEAHYFWRWIGMYAPDLVIVTDSLKKPPMKPIPALIQESINKLKESPAVVKRKMIALEDALRLQAPSNMGRIPAINIGNKKHDLELALEYLNKAKDLPKSPARIEIERRENRSTLKILEELAQVYGNELKSIHYIPSVAVIAKSRYLEITKSKEATLQYAESLLKPFLSRKKKALGSRPNGSQIAGHLILAEYYRLKKNPVALELIQKAADQGWINTNSAPTIFPYHSEMSDAIFMAAPLLSEVGTLNKNDKYLNLCLRHIQSIQKMLLRKDGLYRHSPLDNSAWGRGNGFPALGLAWCLDRLPKGSEEFKSVAKSLTSHLEALIKHQDPLGPWHQVIDHQGSYRELTSTCMITFAMIRGIHHGILNEKKYKPIIEKAWKAVKRRIGKNGELVDVCTGTGKQKNLRAYLDRKAILGKDARGGAMAFLLASEMLSWEMEIKGRK